MKFVDFAKSAEEFKSDVHWHNCCLLFIFLHYFLQLLTSAYVVISVYNLLSLAPFVKSYA